MRFGAWLLSLALCAGCGSGAAALRADGAQFAASYATAPSPGLLLGGAASEPLRRALAQACAAAGLEADGRLAQLASTLAEASRGGQLTPSAALVGYHAHRLGLVDPTPQLWLAGGSAEQIAAALPAALQQAAEGERLTHCGGAALPLADGVLTAVALSRRSLRLRAPIPRVLAAGAPLALDAELARDFDHASLAISGPDGGVQRLALPAGRRIHQSVRLAARGEHMVELLAQGPAGVTVVALFPVDVGVQPARSAPGMQTGPAERDPASIAQQLAASIGRERRARKLAPLVLDARLSEVARLHSEDMRAHHFVAHNSPTTGDASARVVRAGLRASVLLENIGRGYGAAEIHAGLMESPGHRANILNPDVRLLGLGVLAEPEGEHVAFLVTQLFARLAPPLDTARAPRQLLAALGARRAQQKLGRVRLDAALSQAAQRAAERYAAEPGMDQSALLAAAMRGVKAAPAGVAGLGATLVLAEELEQVAETAQMLDPRLIALGVGAVELAPDAPHAIAVVLLFGTRR